MINLLPPVYKEEYHYARRNTSLLRWVTMFGFGIIGVLLISAAGIVFLQREANSYAAQAVLGEQSLKNQQQGKVEAEAKSISNDLKLAVQVLSQEILFSQLLKQMAVNTPSNVRLSGLTISEVKGAVDITAVTANYDAATQLQVNLTDPANKIFDKVDIVSISCASSAERYPCTVLIRALFATDNPFLFINSKAGA